MACARKGTPVIFSKCRWHLIWKIPSWLDAAKWERYKRVTWQTRCVYTVYEQEDGMKQSLHAHLTTRANLQAYYLTVSSQHIRSNEIQSFELVYFWHNNNNNKKTPFAGMFFCKTSLLYFAIISATASLFINPRDINAQILWRILRLVYFMGIYGLSNLNARACRGHLDWWAM